MGFPAGMQLATIAFGIPLTATGKDVVTKVTVKPTSRVIWAATGQPLPEFSDSFTAEAGQLGQFQVPFIDQPGFIDSTGAAVTDFAFQISASWEFGNERPITWNKNLKPLLGQTGTIDLDLVPDGPVSIPVTAPTAAVLGFGGRTGFITLQESDLPPRLSVGDLSATYVPKWKATTAYLAGDKVLSPSGDVVSAKVNFTSGATYSATNWNFSTVGVPKDTDPESIPVLRAVADDKVARWEYIHNGGGGYLWHLLAGAASTNGDWMFGVGLDAGSGGGAIFRNKAAGTGVKLEQLNTITSVTAYGMAIQQNSMAPAVFGELFANGSAPLVKLISYKTDDPTLQLESWQGGNAKGGYVSAADGTLRWETNIETRVGGYFRARNSVTGDDSETAIKNNAAQFTSYSGAVGQYWHKRLSHGGQSLSLELGNDLTAGGPTASPVSWFTAVEAKQVNNTAGGTQLGFFGAVPVPRAAAIASPTAPSATYVQAEAQAMKTAIDALRVALGATSGIGITA